MTDTATQNDTYTAGYETVDARTSDVPAFLRELRSKGWTSFNNLGLPTTKDEEWRFTSVKPIANTSFQLADPDTEVAESQIQPYGFGGVSCTKLVFIDGQFSPEHSYESSLPQGVIATSLRTAISEHADLVEPHLSRYARYEESGEGFTAWNTSMIEDGVFVFIPRGIAVDGPIHVLFASSNHNSTDMPLMCHPRNLIVVEDNAEVMVVEHYVALGENVSLSNVVTEAYVGDNAGLKHFVLERENESAFNISTLAIRQGRDSRVDSHTALFGGAIARNNIEITLAGTGADSLINGLFVGHGTQQLDNHMRVIHAAEHCHSRQLYKGILDEDSHGVFSGRIVVREGAQQTDALQTNRNLLLSDSAHVNTKPQLEIYADDVKCSHGATTGQLDDDQMFYLKQRGIDEQTARGLLIYAFASENIQHMNVGTIRKQLEQALVDKLPQMSSLSELEI